MMERVGDGILQAAKQQELQLDYQLKQMENMDEDDFEVLREKRKIAMQKQLRQDQDWRQLGHGTYSELTDTKEFFHAAKKSSRLCVHFYRSVTPRCEIVDAHFHKLAPKHLETRFVKIDAEKNPYLVSRATRARRRRGGKGVIPSLLELVLFVVCLYTSWLPVLFFFAVCVFRACAC